LVEKWQPELKAFLRLLIFRCSIYATNSTYGNKLQNLEYRNEIPHELAKDIGECDFQPVLKIYCSVDVGNDFVNEATAAKTPLTMGQKLGYAFLTIGGSWIWERLNAVSVANAWGDQPEECKYRRLWVLLNKLETTFKILSLLNFLVFLHDGKYDSQLLSRR